MSLVFNIFSSSLEREKSNQFTIPLSRPIDFSDGEYAVGVKSFFFEKSYLPDIHPLIFFNEFKEEKISFIKFMEFISSTLKNISFYFSYEFFEEFENLESVLTKFNKRKISKNSKIFTVNSETIGYSTSKSYNFIFEYSPYTLKKIIYELCFQLYEQMNDSGEGKENIKDALYFIISSFKKFLHDRLTNWQDVKFTKTIIKANFIQPSYYNSSLEKILHIFIPDKEIINVNYQKLDRSSIKEITILFFNEKNEPILLEHNFFLQFEFIKEK